jgi:ribosomal protein S18 acetylase RimI-like enzyme
MFEFPLTLVPASTISRRRLISLINQAYADYFIPVWLDEERFERMCRNEDIDLARSVVGLVQDKAVAVAMLSVRERQGWVSAVGVLPAWRRKGVGHRVIRSVQAGARAADLTTLRLEVLTQNEAGLALYRQTGFTWERDLLVLTLEAGLFEPASLPPEVRAASAASLLAHYDAFHEVRAPWQRQRPSLAHRAEVLRGLGFWEGERLVGYVLYQVQNCNQTIHDLAVTPGYAQRLEVARTLLLALHRARTDLSGHTINLPAEDPLLPAFTGLRYRIWQRQHELIWDAGVDRT